MSEITKTFALFNSMIMSKEDYTIASMDQLNKALKEYDTLIYELEQLRQVKLQALKVINNALYFDDSSDYETALWDAMAILLGKTNEELYDIKLSYIKE